MSLCGDALAQAEAEERAAIAGRDAAAKARRTAEAILARSRRLMTARNIGDFRRTSIEVLGAEDTYGASARAAASREVILKVAVHHDDKEGCEIFAREFLPSATAMAQGITDMSMTRECTIPTARRMPRPVPIRKPTSVALSVTSA